MFYRKSKKSLEQEGKVMAFLKENPLSTAEEIHLAVGPVGLIGLKYVRGKMYDGKWVWRLNLPKMKKDGLI